MPLTAEQRTMRARLAGLASAAKNDVHASTARARRGFDARFEREVDPDGVLPPLERRRRAEAARSAYFTSLAFKASVARSKRAKNGTDPGASSPGRASTSDGVNTVAAPAI